MIASQLSPLSRLDYLAQQIVEPSIYGSFIDDSHYLAALEILLGASGETDNRINFFMNKVIPYVNSQHLLDIGIGDGVLTKPIGKNFKQITLVDSSKEALENISKADFSINCRLRKIHQSISGVKLAKNEYDLAVISHTLYYLDKLQWLEVIANIFSSLKSKSTLVIVLNGGLDKDQLAYQFGGEAINIESLARDCSNALDTESIQLYYEKEIFQTQALLTMLHIANLHLYDVHGKTNKKNLSAFLQKRRNKHNNLFEFSIYQKFIVIKKS